MNTAVDSIGSDVHSFSLCSPDLLPRDFTLDSWKFPLDVQIADYKVRIIDVLGE
jgi:hypothetical protein